VFDARKAVTFSSHAKVIGRCALCEAPSSRLENCADVSCRRQLVFCDPCAILEPFCSSHQSLRLAPSGQKVR